MTHSKGALRPFFLNKLFIVFCNFLFIFIIVKRHRAFRIWRSKNLYIIILLCTISVIQHVKFSVLEVATDNINRHMTFMTEETHETAR